MGYKNENIKHRQGIANKPKHQCPKCKNGLQIDKPKFIVVCSKCKTLIKEDEIIINQEYEKGKIKDKIIRQSEDEAICSNGFFIVAITNDYHFTAIYLL